MSGRFRASDAATNASSASFSPGMTSRPGSHDRDRRIEREIVDRLLGRRRDEPELRRGAGDTGGVIQIHRVGIEEARASDARRAGFDQNRQCVWPVSGARPQADAIRIDSQRRRVLVDVLEDVVNVPRLVIQVGDSDHPRRRDQLCPRHERSHVLERRPEHPHRAGVGEPGHENDRRLRRGITLGRRVQIERERTGVGDAIGLASDGHAVHPGHGVDDPLPPDPIACS